MLDLLRQIKGHRAAPKVVSVDYHSTAVQTRTGLPQGRVRFNYPAKISELFTVFKIFNTHCIADIQVTETPVAITVLGRMFGAWFDRGINQFPDGSNPTLYTFTEADATYIRERLDDNNRLPVKVITWSSISVREQEITRARVICGEEKLTENEYTPNPLLNCCIFTTQEHVSSAKESKLLGVSQYIPLKVMASRHYQLPITDKAVHAPTANAFAMLRDTRTGELLIACHEQPVGTPAVFLMALRAMQGKHLVRRDYHGKDASKEGLFFIGTDNYNLVENGYRVEPLKFVSTYKSTNAISNMHYQLLTCTTDDLTWTIITRPRKARN